MKPCAIVKLHTRIAHWREPVLKSISLPKLMARRAMPYVALLLLVVASGATAQNFFIAQSDNVPEQVEESVEAAQVSQRQALELVRTSFLGNVISINPVQQRGMLVYRVRMDNEGNIFTVYVNATTGVITREQ